MINILIIEDDSNQLETIKKTINTHLGHLVELHPKYIEDVEGNLNDFNRLIETLQQRKFKEVAEYYYWIDLFIIDVTLTGRNDTLGIEFYEFLQKQNSKIPNAIIISYTTESKRFIRSKNTPFVAKLDQGSENYSNRLVELIKDKYKLGGIGNEVENPSIFELFKDRIHHYGLHYAVLNLMTYVIKNFERYILDPIILFFFYILLTATIFFGGYNIFNDITHLNSNDSTNSSKTMENKVKDVSKNVEDTDNSLPEDNVTPSKVIENNDTMLLKTAEHIFLNLLPIFIVFGFFNYYKTNIRISLLEGNIYAVSDEISTKTINLSKILFISSIISYVLIKIIEMLFFTRDAADINRLIAAGVFLLLLMSYFIFLDKKKH